MDKILIIRFGDLMLKGDNKKQFIRALIKNIKFRLRKYNCDLDIKHDRLYVLFANQDNNYINEIIQVLTIIPGIVSLSIAYKISKELKDIKTKALELLEKYLSEQNIKTISFKVESKRADKTFELTSLQLSQVIASYLLKALGPKLVVDVKTPELTLNIEVRFEDTYLFFEKISCFGGFPAGISGKGLLMMSGGIDSPVAGVLSIKTGIDVSLIHFESSPLTPIESVNKVCALAKTMTKFNSDAKIKLYVVPFFKIHEILLKKVYDPYIITVMRRFMYRISQLLCEKLKIQCLINGESIGQVASQTLGSMKTINNVCSLPIIRPLATYDKKDIVYLSKKWGFFEESIKPFNDCCSIYVPKHPATNPKIEDAIKYENVINNLDELVSEAVSKTLLVKIDEDFNVDFSSYSTEFSEAHKAYLSEITIEKEALND